MDQYYKLWIQQNHSLRPFLTLQHRLVEGAGAKGLKVRYTFKRAGSLDTCLSISFIWANKKEWVNYKSYHAWFHMYIVVLSVSYRVSTKERKSSECVNATESLHLLESFFSIFNDVVSIQKFWITKSPELKRQSAQS